MCVCVCVCVYRITIVVKMFKILDGRYNSAWRVLINVLVHP